MNIVIGYGDDTNHCEGFVCAEKIKSDVIKILIIF
jgi:hypothetical protein